MHDNIENSVMMQAGCRWKNHPDMGTRADQKSGRIAACLNPFTAHNAFPRFTDSSPSAHDADPRFRPGYN